VATQYWDFNGNQVTVSAQTLSAVLEALGFDTSDQAAVERSLTEVSERPWRRALPPIVVCRQGSATQVALHLPHGEPAEVWVVLEDGTRREVRQVDNEVAPRMVDHQETGEATFETPDNLPLGWHLLCAQVGDGTFSSPLVISPAALALPARLRPDGTRAWGLMTQLYSVRSRQSWGLETWRTLAT